MVLGFVVYELLDITIHTIKLGALGIQGAIGGIAGFYTWLYPPLENIDEKKSSNTKVQELEMRIVELEKQLQSVHNNN
tara:strand:- start:426 stop:659 length:234 start_codon:yes stop_codon:yes gene_type:complete